MAIYRGVGGSGESTTNTIVNLVAQYTFDAEAAKIAATAEAANAAASAANAAASAASITGDVASAEAARVAAEAAAAAADSSETDAEAAQVAAEAAQAAAEATVANSVTLNTDQTITGVKTFSQTIVGSIDGNAATATNVAYSGLTGTVPTWNQDTTGNAATVTNGVYLATTQTLTNKTLDGGTY